MSSRKGLLTTLMALLAAVAHTSPSHQDFCTRMCPRTEPRPPTACPACAACPSCPTPQCPPLPEIPRCEIPQCPPPVVNVTLPDPICPSLPRIPECPTPVVNLQCPEVIRQGYVTLQRMGTYKFYADEKNWHGARKICALEGASLVLPRSSMEVNRLLEIMKNNEVGNIHVGFHDIDSEGNFITVLGHPLTSDQKTLWAAGEPGSGRDYNCVYLNRNSKMYDQRCTDTEAFICEVFR